MQVRDISEQMSVFVCFVFVLFVNVCQQWACELEDVKLLVGLVQDGDVGLEVVSFPDPLAFESGSVLRTL